MWTRRVHNLPGLVRVVRLSAEGRRDRVHENRVIPVQRHGPAGIEKEEAPQFFGFLGSLLVRYFVLAELVRRLHAPARSTSQTSDTLLEIMNSS